MLNNGTDNNKWGLSRERILILVALGYMALVIFANLGSLRVVLLGALAIDGGTLLYPFSFTMRDVLHKKAGASLTRFVIILTAVVNLLMFAFVWLVGIMPPDPEAGAQAEYALVLAPGIRLVLGSIIAMAVSELIDTSVYSLVRKRLGSSRQWLRVALSNLVSIPVDTGIFILIAFAGRYDFPVLVSIFVSNLLIKFAVSLVSLPAVYAVKEDRD